MITGCVSIWKFPYYIFFTFFSHLELPSYNLLSFNWNTVCPTLLQKCLAHFKTYDGIFLLLKFLKLLSIVVPETQSSIIPSSWWHCQNRYVIVPFGESMLQSALEVQTSGSLLSEASDWVVYNTPSVPFQTEHFQTAGAPKALACFHIHLVKDS